MSDQKPDAMRRGWRRIAAKPKAILFQFAALAAGVLVMILVVPIFLRVVIPTRQREVNARVTEYAGPVNDRFNVKGWLPENGKELSFYQKGWLDNEFSVNVTSSPLFSATNYTGLSWTRWMQGWMDLTLQVKTFDPDALRADMQLTGLPFGMLAGRQRVQEVWLRKVSTAYNGTTTTNLASCGADGRHSMMCADLKVYVGNNKVSLGTGDVLGYTEVHVDASTGNGLDYYPFDTYTVRGEVEVHIDMWVSADRVLQEKVFVQGINATKEADAKINKLTEPVKGLEELTKEEYTVLPAPVPFTLEMLPGISGWSTNSATLTVDLRNQTAVAVNNNTIVSSPYQRVIIYEVVYGRSSFVKFFAVMIVVLMWILSLYLLVLSIDNVLYRPRTLDPGTVGYGVGMLFALPTLRMLLTAPLGAYIDLLGFTWCMLLTAIAVIVFFSGAYTDHRHEGEVFSKVEQAPQVAIAKESIADLLQVLQAMDSAALAQLRHRKVAAADQEENGDGMHAVVNMGSDTYSSRSPLRAVAV